MCILLAAPLTAGLPSAGDVKVGDFGLAVVVTASMSSAGATMAGTEWYYSPEKARGMLASRGPVDMWAVGCVMLELLTGTRLGGPIWDEGTAIKDHRADLVKRASAADARLGAAAGMLLEMTPEERLSAMQLLVFLHSGDAGPTPRLAALVPCSTLRVHDPRAAAGAAKNTTQQVCSWESTLACPDSCDPIRHLRLSRTI